MKPGPVLKIIPTLLFLLFSLIAFELPGQSDSSAVCLSKPEKELYNLIMEYRKSKKLPPIPLSTSLTIVAQTHSKDLYENQPVKGDCNLHSWSKNGKWGACCYYPDHRNKECMWDKPKELTDYQWAGFEISYYHSAMVEPKEALQGWKKSPGHNMMVVNADMWKKINWNAIGIGIYKNYATVWFGSESDPAGIVKECIIK